MTVLYASGKKALGICDRCGKTCKYQELRYQIFNQQNTQLKVCADCLDEDQPELQLGRIPINDPQALMQPRPDTTVLASRRLFSFNPAGANIFPAFGRVGQVTASGG